MIVEMIDGDNDNISIPCVSSPSILTQWLQSAASSSLSRSTTLDQKVHQASCPPDASQHSPLFEKYGFRLMFDAKVHVPETIAANYPCGRWCRGADSKI